MSDASNKQAKPRLRPAETITQDEAKTIFASGDANQIQYALIDGSRCLDNDFIYPFAVSFLDHADAGVRYGAAFAMSMCRNTIVKRLKQDWEPVHSLNRLAAMDPDESVRGMAVQALIDFLSASMR